MTRPDAGSRPPEAAQQPAAGERAPIQPPKPSAPQPAQAPGGGKERRSINKLRVAGYALLVVAVLAALVPILGLASDQQSSSSQAARQAAEQTTTTTTRSKENTEKSATRKPRASTSATRSKPASSTTRKSREPAADTAGLGPIITDEATERAEAEQARRKLIVGGVAVGLLLIVLWGRRVRAAKSKQ